MSGLAVITKLISIAGRVVSIGTAPAAEPMALSGEDTDRLAKLRQEEIEALRALGLDLSVWTGPAQVKKRRLEPA